jgi:hypothetical protein
VLPFFFFGYLSYNHHRSRPPPRSHHPTATHVLRIDHSLHSESHPPFAPLRGVATRHVSATSSRFRTCEGVFHWRLLGALNKRDARAAYSRRIVAPSSSLRPLPLWIVQPRLLSVVLRQSIPSNQSHVTHHQPRAIRPVLRILSDPPRNGRAVLRKEKRVWRLETCDGALDFAPPPLGRRPARASCKRLGYAKADSCPPPAASDCAARYQRGTW